MKSVDENDVEPVEAGSAVQEEQKWLPTAENVNALPEGVRRFVHDLATRCDPAGDVAALTGLRDQIDGVQVMYRKAADALEEVRGCFHAAEVEGLSTALTETTDEHLKDLVERRLMHALYAAQEVATHPAEPVGGALVAKDEQQNGHVMPPFAAPASQHEAGVSAWVSVEDWLPPNAELPNGDWPSVLAIWKEGSLDAGLVQTMVTNTAYFCKHVQKFTHWMPLPPLPEQSQLAGAARAGGDTINGKDDWLRDMVGEMVKAHDAASADALVAKDELDTLAAAIAQAAIKRGIIAPDTPLTGPQLVLLCNDLATESAAAPAEQTQVAPVSANTTLSEVIKGWEAYAFSTLQDDRNGDLCQAITEIKAAIARSNA